MGQYHHIAILAKKHESIHPTKRVKATISPYDYHCYAKLTEWGYLCNDYTLAMESLINDENGKYSGYPLVVCGDYADNETYNGEVFTTNLYGIVRDESITSIKRLKGCKHSKGYRYGINHTKKQYVSLDIEGDWIFHPIALLCAESNGRGGGDYFGRNFELVGTWARDCISVSNNIPDGYEEIKPNFGYEG